jgi:hypothetical protein
LNSRIVKVLGFGNKMSVEIDCVGLVSLGKRQTAMHGVHKNSNKLEYIDGHYGANNMSREKKTGECI